MAKKKVMESKCGGSLTRKCKTKVGDDDKALQCARCSVWFHITCQNVSAKRYEKIKELNELEDKEEPPDGVEWRCDRCRVISSELEPLMIQMKKIEQETSARLNEFEKGIQESLNFTERCMAA